ncbi:MAG: DUF2058 domain-containing protein [Pseudomonadales bacterium]|nr:DUF2058 domain-containing protein [Pseudomonadales bacterium]
MAKSLQDQLLKSGLVNKKQSNKSKADKHKQKVKKNKRSKSKIDADDESKQLVRQRLEDKKKTDAELNRKRELLAEEKAIQSQIIQLIEMNAISRSDGDVAFNFTDDKKIKKIFVTTTLQEQLSCGRLAIVSVAGEEKRYEIVPVAVAEKIKMRDDSCITFISDTVSAEIEENDPYADYKIPDDLMW